MRALVTGSWLTLLCACGGGGGSEPAPRSPDAAPTARARREAAPDVKGEIGALDAKAVTATFEGAMKKVEACQDDRRRADERLDFLSGEVSVEVRVTEAGAARAVWLTRSTVGDRATERCIVAALGAAAWPKPQGGREGIAKNGFTLPMKGDRDAVAWDAAKVAGELAKARAALAACTKGGHAEVTLYVDAQGKVITAGAASAADGGDAAADCLAREVSKLKFSSPGGWPAKVTATVD
ncbi:MAG: hypothetical protein IT374_08375 [Polyangiaceae bacterium]|nr:hypothetical protein [Polyangiaceae bacterium]